MKHEDFFTTEEEISVNIKGNLDEVIEFKKLKLKDSDVLKIEENVNHHWRGVTSCGHADRIKNESWTKVQSWAKNKIFEYREYRYVRYGNKAHTVYVEQWKDPITGKRKCGARTTIPCFIEFRRVNDL